MNDMRTLTRLNFTHNSQSVAGGYGLSQALTATWSNVGFNSVLVWRISQIGASLHFLFSKNLIPCVDRITYVNFNRPLLTSNTTLF